MKKENVLEKMIHLIKQQDFRKGDRLPSERELGALLGTSRPTVRESLRKLEERGLLSIRPGSGVYLTRNSHHLDAVTPNEPIADHITLRDQLEALFLLAPTVVEWAVRRAEETEIAKLNDCIIRMSRAIVMKNIGALAEADMDFYRHLGGMTKNHQLSRMLEQLLTGNEGLWIQLSQSVPFVNTIFFPGYVEIVTAVKHGEPETAAQKTRQTILKACQWLAKNNPRFDFSRLFKKTGVADPK